MFAERISGFEEGPEDFKELTLLLSQLSCFKKDLMGVAKQIEATRYQPFATQLDMEPIAETTGRCFAKTIPPRDLELAFEKWSKRGNFLITRLCTSANLSEAPGIPPWFPDAVSPTHTSDRSLLLLPQEVSIACNTFEAPVYSRSRKAGEVKLLNEALSGAPMYMW